MLRIGDRLRVNTPDGPAEGVVETYRELAPGRQLLTLADGTGNRQRVLLGSTDDGVATPLAGEVDALAARELAEAVLSGRPVIGPVSGTINRLAMAVVSMTERRK